MRQGDSKPTKVWGFSLVELMAAAAIMGILVSLALPRYRLFVARSRMAEAKANLGIIATLQQSYFAEYQTYVNMPPMGGKTGNCGAAEKNELGFRVTDCSRLLYIYDSGGIFTATAKNEAPREIYPGCTEADIWTIDQKRTLTHTNSAIKRCHN